MTTTSLTYLGLGLNTFANAEIDSLLERYPADTLFASWVLEYTGIPDAGKELHNYSNEELHTLFFQYMDSTQESLVNSFVALARDSVYIYSLERISRGFQSNIYSEEQHSELLLYPNPVSQILNLEFADVKGALFVTDLLGQVKYTKNDFAYFHTINTLDFSNGVYIVVVIDETGKRSSSRFIVLK